MRRIQSARFYSKKREAKGSQRLSASFKLGDTSHGAADCQSRREATEAPSIGR